MKRIVWLVIITMLFCNNLFAQKKRKKKKEVEIFLSTFFNINLNSTLFYAESFSSTTIQPFNSTIRGTQRDIRNISELINVGFSIQQLKNNNRYTEISLMKLAWSKSEFTEFRSPFFEYRRGSNIENFEFDFRFEYGSYLHFDDESKWCFGIGGGFSPYIYLSKLTPRTATTFPNTILRYGVKLEFVPSVSYRLSRNGFINLKWSPSIFDINRHHSNVGNPILSEKQRIKTYRVPSFFKSPYSFQLHYRHQILGKKDSKKHFKKVRKEKEVDQKNKKSKNKKYKVTFAHPILNIYSREEDLTYRYSIDGVETTTQNRTNKSILNFGIGVQFVKEKGAYKEIALTRFSVKKNISRTIVRYPEVPNVILPTTFTEDNSFEIKFACRYEIGKIFTNPYAPQLPRIFSIGAGIEPFFHRLDWMDDQVTNIGLHLKITPAASFRISHRLFLQLKWTPTVASTHFHFFNLGADTDSERLDNNSLHFQGFPNLVNGNLGLRLRI